MGKVFLTRHGETVWNIEGRLQGWNDSPLTENGVKQAEWLYERLREEKIDYIYSSPSGRAFETANILNKDWGLEINKSDDLREIGLGDWQGLNQQELREKYGEMVDIYWTTPSKYINNSGETFEDVINRTEKFLCNIIKEHKDNNILIVTHTVALKGMLLKLEGKELDDIWDEPFIKQTSLTIIDHDGINIAIEVHADASHHKEKYIKNPHY